VQGSEKICVMIFSAKCASAMVIGRRSADCEHDETPRYRDLLTKLTAKRLARPRMRKTGQNVC
jgi:hypothetical protein